MNARILSMTLLVACGPDLPAGWEEARPVASLSQAECSGNPYEGYDERATADLTSDPLAVSVLEAHFRCEQDVEAFWKQDGGTVSVLVQPIDMNPSVVAGCDCLFDLDITVGTPSPAAEEVRVFRRWDNLNDDNDPVPVPFVTE